MVGLNDVGLWDLEAPTYDDAADHGLRDAGVRAAWRELLLGVMPAAPAQVADLGCGTGTLSLLLAEEGYAVDGVDFSPEMVRRAQAKAGGRARFQLGDAAEPPLTAGTYDVVLSRHVLWTMPDPAAALQRWTTLLAPGGRLLLIEGNWSTGAGLAATRALRLVHDTGRRAELRHLQDAEFWGRDISDERYLIVSRP